MVFLPRKVLFLATHLSVLDSRFLKLRRSLEGAGCAVASAAPRFRTETPPDRVETVAGTVLDHFLERTARLPRIGMPAAFLHSVRRRSSMLRVAERFKPDLIIAFDPETLPAAVEAKERTGARLIYDAHEYFADQGPGPGSKARSAWVERAHQKYFPMLDGLVTVNSSIADQYSATNLLKRHPFVLRNLTDWEPSFDSTDRLRRAAGLPSETRVLLYHGALQTGRGLPLLVELTEHLPEDWAIVVMGEGPMRSRIATAQQTGRLHLLDPVPFDELSGYLRTADAGAVLYEDISLNLRFSLPNKLWEYASAGVPIVATDLPEIGALVRDHGIGFLVSSSPDAAELGAVLASLTPDALSKAGMKGRRLAEANTWADEMRGFMDWLDRGGQR